MKDKVATIARSAQRFHVKKICLNDLQREFSQPFYFLRTTKHAADTHSLFCRKSFRQPAPDKTRRTCH
jgi:hypothetical protein